MGTVSIPGAFTATEVVTAYKAGGDLIKVFPASNPQYIKDLKGPLDHIPLMPTGGVNLQNIREFQKAGAVAFGIGSSLVDAKQKLTPEYLRELTQKATQFVHTVNNV
jgi:2-dehydro-3-deoxyphosphogluconate aldolase/(4S)-4-hydroxy-2-oxoglutarate aldolase